MHLCGYMFKLTPNYQSKTIMFDVVTLGKLEYAKVLLHAQRRK